MRIDCPQRKGSQGFEKAQSQLVEGQGWIQHVPSSPNMGQRSQFQSQGVARAPSVTQAG